MSKLGIEAPQFLENGEPCASYVVYFGEANQDPVSFPKAPYADAAYLNALSENLTLDSNGMFAVPGKEIYLNGLYSFAIYRPNGTPYYELDSIEGFQGDAGSVTQSYVDSAITERISEEAWFHNDSSLNSGLSFSVGKYRVQGAHGAFYENASTTSVTLNDNVTEAVVFNLNDGMFYKVDTDSVEAHHLHLFTVTTLSGSITSITDKRTHIDSRNRLPAGYISGLSMAVNSTDPDNDIDFSAGHCKDSTNAADMVLASALTKRLDAAWAIGNNAGGLFSGSVAPSTTYYCFIIQDPDGTEDCGFDIDPAAANRPAGYTRFRQLGEFVTDGASTIASWTLYDGIREQYADGTRSGQWTTIKSEVVAGGEGSNLNLAGASIFDELEISWVSLNHSASVSFDLVCGNGGAADVTTGDYNGELAGIATDKVPLTNGAVTISEDVTGWCRVTGHNDSSSPTVFTVFSVTVNDTTGVYADTVSGVQIREEIAVHDYFTVWDGGLSGSFDAGVVTFCGRRA